MICIVFNFQKGNNAELFLSFWCFRCESFFQPKHSRLTHLLSFATLLNEESSL